MKNLDLARSARTALFGLACIWAAGAAAAQTTWYVDDDDPSDPGPGNPFISNPAESGSAAAPFDRVQEAIDAAASGDEVVVLPGLYFDFATIDLSSSTGGGAKALHIRSQDGPAVTTIDATALGDSVVEAVQGETPQTIFEGFTLTGGDPGGAVGDHGGGMLIQSSSPTVKNCVFAGNFAYLGGGVYAEQSGTTFDECVFLGNDADWQGGGLYQNAGNITLSRCWFELNQSVSAGGGSISRGVGSSSITVRDCVYYDNTAGGGGGGMHRTDAFPLLVERTKFVANTAAGGGGLFVHGGGTVRDCLFDSNTSTNSQGGGFNNWSGGNVVLTGSTFYNNSGFDIYVFGGSNAQVTNCILWSTVPPVSGPATISHSDVIGGFAGAGNIDADPMFVDPWGADGMLGTMDDDLRLLAESPCIDSGDTRVPADLSPATQYPVDLALEPRAADRPNTPDTGVAVLGITVDMGAHEFQPPLRKHRRTQEALAPATRQP